MIDGVIPSLIGLIASLVATLVSYFIGSQKRHDREKRDSAGSEIAVAIGPVRMTKFYGGGEAEPIATQDLIKRMEEQILARVQSSSRDSQTEIQREVEVQLARVRERISKIEDRFPAEARLEKIASINDALLSERIDQLSKQVVNIERKMLSHWDVALVVSAIIAAIIAMISATFGVLKVISVIP